MICYLSFVAVNPEKLEQRVHALLVMEELGGKVTVEELDTVSDGFRESRARERRSEWLKVQLKHKVPIDTAKKTKNKKK